MAKVVKKKKMVHYDKDSDILNFGVKKGFEEEFVEIAPGVSAEFDEKKNLIGIEVLNASKILKPVLKSAI
jgi:uncharacterized protein YuzE